MPRGPGKQLIYTPAIPASGSGYINPGQIAGGAAQTVAASSAGGAGADLIRTVAGLGHDALKIVAREHEIEAQGRIEEAVLSASNEFEKWKADYMQNRQGRDALSAQEDFTNKFAEIRDQTLKEFGYENTIFHDRLKRELTRHGLYALKDGGQYQTTQSAAWKKSVLEGKLAAFENLCANHPEDMERIDIEEQAALASWQALNPGLDPAAMRAKLANTKAVGVLSAHMAREDYEGAKALLGVGGNSSGGGTIAEDMHNPLNLKRVGPMAGTAQVMKILKLTPMASGVPGGNCAYTIQNTGLAPRNQWYGDGRRQMTATITKNILRICATPALRVWGWIKKRKWA